MKAANFCVIAGQLYKMGSDEVLCRYVPKNERHSILVEPHDGVVGEHYEGKATAQKILRVGIWWPIIHKESKEYCNACDVCQRTRRSSRRDEILLNPHVTLQ